jgi:carbon monoxide dehydrogenase subunit G
VRATRELLVETPPETLWTLLWDVPRMAACLPGCTDAQEVTPHRRYRARMTQKVGPISLSVPLDVEILAAEPPRRLALSARGRDPLVGAEISMRVTIDCEPSGAGARLSIGAEGQVLGKLGGLGQGIIQRKAEEALDEFGRRLAREAAGHTGG